LLQYPPGRTARFTDGSASYVENWDVPAREFELPAFHRVDPAGVSIAEYFVQGKKHKPSIGWRHPTFNSIDAWNTANKTVFSAKADGYRPARLQTGRSPATPGSF
jgi:hypothetical protein